MKRLENQLCAALTRHLRDKGRPVVPEAGRVLWDVFTQLSGARGFHQYGPNPISYAEIEAWARLTRTPLQPHHVQIIRAMDAAFIDHFALTRTERTPEGVKTAPRGSGHALSPAIFDAVLG